jgi:hypothetical protein
MIKVSPEHYAGASGPGQQLGKAVVDAGHTKIRFALEGAAQVMDTVCSRPAKTRQ